MYLKPIVKIENPTLNIKLSMNKYGQKKGFNFVENRLIGITIISLKLTLEFDLKQSHNQTKWYLIYCKDHMQRDVPEL